MKNKKAVTPLVFIAILVGLLAGLVTLGIVKMPAFIGYEPVFKSEGGHLHCIQHTYYDSIYSTKLTSSEKIIRCDYETDKCEVEGVCEKDGIRGCTVFYQLCDSEGENCQTTQTLSLTPRQKKSLQNLEVGESYKFKQSFMNPNEKDIKITLKAKTYYLWGEENDYPFTQEGCILNMDAKKHIPIATGCPNKLDPDEWCSYHIAWDLIETKVYSYQGQRVICQAREVYKIDKVEYMNNEIRNIQGQRLAGYPEIECCPHELNCGEDFKFQQEVPKDCPSGSDAECPFAGKERPTGDGRSTTRWYCENYNCIESDKIYYECTNNQKCIEKYGQGWSCKNYKCMEADPDWCGDGVCTAGETISTCPEDCSIICAPDEVLVERIYKTNCLIPYINIGCEEVIEKRCESVEKGIGYWIIVGILIIIGAIFFFTILFPIIRALLARVGLKF